MGSVKDEAELEDGEINDLEDGEIEDEEYYDGNISPSSRQWNQIESEVQSSQPIEFQVENVKRYPLRDRPSTTRRLRNECDDLERGREWNKGRNVARGRIATQMRHRGRDFLRRSGMPVPRHHSLSPVRNYTGHIDLKSRSPSPLPVLPYHGYPGERHRLSPLPLYNNHSDNPAPQWHRSPPPHQSVERGELLPSRNFAVRPFFGDNQSHPVSKTNSQWNDQNQMQKENKGEEDFDLLLERHKLIQQQLESLEKQEKAALAAENIIDETFIDIPLDDRVFEAGIPNIGTGVSTEPDVTENENFCEETSQQLSVNTNMGNDDDSINSELDSTSTKNFLPFKIKAQYSSVPSLSERSRLDLEMRKTKGESTVNLATVESNSSMNSTKIPASDSSSQVMSVDPMLPLGVKAASTGGPESNSKRPKRRRRSRRRKKTPAEKFTPNTGTVPKTNATLVDPHTELENKLFDLAVTSSFQEEALVTYNQDLETNTRGDIQDRQKKRKEQLKKWQESHSKKAASGSLREKNNNSSSNSKITGGLSKKKKKNDFGGKSASKLGSNKVVMDIDEYEFDDYLETPMDVESDSAEGPVLPLIEDSSDKPPPPPLPSEFDNQFAHLMGYQDTATTAAYRGPPFPSQVVDGGFEASFYNREQEPYESWMPGCDDEIGNFNQDDGFQARLGLQVAANDEDGRDDDDDEDALRALLLKSMANKRAAKLAAESKPSPVSSAPASPGTEPSKPLPGKKSSTTGSLVTKPKHKALMVPPQHEPVVIQLGQDSDDSDDDEEDQRKTGVGPPGGGLFGGLELMIKEARKSADVSKSKVESPDRKELSSETQKVEVPKTPEALEHMPDYKKAEYKRLKEKLAQYEKKKRQPLSAVNQDKESSDNSATKNKHFPPSLIKLAGHVKECETKLAKHRKILDQDQALLSTVNNNVTEKKSTLEKQEAKVQLLQQQLESAQRLVLRTRLLVGKLNEQGKSIKERVTRKLLVMSDVEEELLRAKSFVSASKRHPATLFGEGSPYSDQASMESENKQGGADQGGATGSENKLGRWSGAGLVQQITDSLVQKLQRLTEVNKKEGVPESGVKRNFQDTVSSSGDETIVKKTRTESRSLLTKNLSPRGSPGKSAPNTPRKSAVAERIALEKARLMKEEHELAEKLKLYNSLMDKDSYSQHERFKSGVSGSVQNSDQVSAQERDVTGSDRIQEDVLTERGGSRNTMQVASADQFQAPDGKNESVQDSKFDMSDKQLEYVRKLQNEKEQRSTTLELSSLELPVPVHESASQCVWLSSRGPLKTLVPSDELNAETATATVKPETGTSFISQHKSLDNGFSPTPLEKYESILLYFRSYRLSPYYRTQSNLSLSSTSFTTKLDPSWPLCSFDLQGVCNDEECTYQHGRDFKMTKEEILQDIAAYDIESPKMNQSDEDMLHNRIIKLAVSFDNRYKDKMSLDEICLLLVNKVRRSRKITGPYSIATDPRVWRPFQEKRDVHQVEQESIVDRGKGITFLKEESIFGVEKQNVNSSKKSKFLHEGDDSQDTRYFSESYGTTDSIEATLSESPHEVELWIKLAELKLVQKSESEEITDQMNERNLRQALSILSRGLEANRNAEELWLFYLQLYTAQGTSEDVNELYEQALDFAPAYRIWWQYMELQSSYSNRKILCLRLLDYLVHNPHENAEIQSHYVLETVLYVVQLELFTGRFKKALEVFQAALALLKGPKGNVQVRDLTFQLLPSDHCLLWIAYIHVFEFHRVPSQWYKASCGKPSRMVAKEPFVFPWQPSQGSRASDEKLLSLFHDALKACTNRKLAKGKSVSIAMPLYMNLVALERAHERLDSAKGICCRLLQSNPTNAELWQCRAALEQAQGSIDGVKEVYEEALVKCRGHAALVYSAARFFSEQGDPVRAQQLLTHYVYSKFTVGTQNITSETSLAELPFSSELPDPELLYRKLLCQPLPYDFKCPSQMQGVTENLKEQQVFLWLNYCLLLELSSNDPTSRNPRLEGAYETAVHSAMDRKSVQSLWVEYLFYKRSRVLHSINDSEKVRDMEDLVHRCLMSCPTSRLIPYSTTHHWQDYSFHNQVISLYLACLPQSRWSAALLQFLKWFPDNANLALQACAHELSRGNTDEAKRIAAGFLSHNPTCISMWKMWWYVMGAKTPHINQSYVYHHVKSTLCLLLLSIEHFTVPERAANIELKRNCIKEARKLYQQATDKLPFAATLWKDFLMFEIARSDDRQGVSGIVERCRQLGVDIDEFYKTLQGK